MEFYERVSGARMHAAFYRPNEVDWTGLNHQFFLDVTFFAKDCFKTLTEIFTVLTTNRIWKSRLINIGAINLNDAISNGATGPVIRSTGVRKDLRFIKSETYSYYWFLSIQGYLGKRGDSYDRFLIRLREMYESVNVIFQLLTNLSLLTPSTLNNDSQLGKGNSFFSFLNSPATSHFNKLNHNTK